MASVLPDLDTAELRSFVVLAEQRHFGRAADILCVSQPALSKRLRRLEEKVGGPLLLRGYRDVRLTEPGRLLLERAKALLREAEVALRLARRAVKGEAGLLRIGFGVASIAKLLPDVLRRFRRSHPDVQIQMRDMSSPDQMRALSREEIEVGFVRLPVEHGEIECAPILHERLVAAVGARFSRGSRGGLAPLRDEPFVVCSRSVSASYHDHVLALCRSAGFTPRIVQETSELFSLLQLVRAGIGVALVPSTAAAMRVPGVRFQDLRSSAAAWDVGLAWKKGTERSPLVGRFLEVARQVYSPSLEATPLPGPRTATARWRRSSR
jgi:DNA-binding transcriptional LysR family regulator